MALRISDPNPPPRMPTQMEATADPAVIPMNEMMQPPSGGLVSPETARYFGPEAVCENCIHFVEPGSCEVVAGPIDPGGRCCNYEADTDTETDEAADTLEAMPVAEDVAPIEDEEAY